MDFYPALCWVLLVTLSLRTKLHGKVEDLSASLDTATSKRICLIHQSFDLYNGNVTLEIMTWLLGIICRPCCKQFHVALQEPALKSVQSLFH